MTQATMLPFTPEGMRERFARMDARIEALERQAAKPVNERPQTPGVFSWSGQIDGFLNQRTSPWQFRTPGRLYAVHYLWDTAPATTVTVKWYYDGSSTALWTHTVAASATHVESENEAYDGERLVAEVTEGDATGTGLTALVFIR